MQLIISVTGGNMSIKVKAFLNKETLVYLLTIIFSVVILLIGNKITTKNLNMLSGAEGVSAE